MLKENKYRCMQILKFMKLTLITLELIPRIAYRDYMELKSFQTSKEHEEISVKERFLASNTYKMNSIKNM